jgi:hypothetical protein
MQYQHLEFGFGHPSEVLNSIQKNFHRFQLASAIGRLNRVDRVLGKLLAGDGRERECQKGTGSKIWVQLSIASL